MEYKSVSIKSVIGKVISDTGVQDTTLIMNMDEWIPQAMELMRTKVRLVRKWKEVEIDFHKGKLPCCLKTLHAVSHCGRRLRYYQGMRTFGAPKQNCEDNSNLLFVSDPAAPDVITTTTTGTLFQRNYTWRVPTDNTEHNYYFYKLGTPDLTGFVGILTNFDTTDSGTIADSVGLLENNLNALGAGNFAVSFDNSTNEIVIVSLSNPNNLTFITVVTTADPGGTIYNAVVDTISIDVNGQSRVEVDRPYIPAQSFDLRTIMNQPLCDETYYTELDYINTSFKCGKVILFYSALPTDDEGFPLIPDNGDYKEALYFFTRGKMIGRGFKDNVFKWQDCNAMFEHHAARAIGQIKYPSVDQVESKLEMTRLIMPDDMYEKFFDNPGKEGMYTAI